MKFNSNDIVTSHLATQTALDLVTLIHPFPNNGVRATLDSRKDLLLLLNSNMVVEQVRGILNPERHGGGHEAEGDRGVADHPEGI